MGLTPLPCIPPPQPTFEDRLRAELTPGRDWIGDALSLTLTAGLMALVVAPLMWWLS